MTPPPDLWKATGHPHHQFIGPLQGENTLALVTGQHLPRATATENCRFLTRGPYGVCKDMAKYQMEADGFVDLVQFYPCHIECPLKKCTLKMDIIVIPCIPLGICLGDI